MTATPRVYTARVKGKVTLLNSMDDEAVYGPVVHRLSFAAAASRNLICRYKVLVSVVTRSEVLAAIWARRTMKVSSPSTKTAAKTVVAVGIGLPVSGAHLDDRALPAELRGGEKSQA